ncbi:hypothetical protein [Rhizobium sp. MHM7A]|uniref:hypothetical protein n=1 Tax=Rhizobium sp. MHM7A TaxID=2583233 RepID=UPI0011070163|nr:hypothetical protein [Rhizobium sp. MHM7A]TLX16605.1 hypothetical protein FFR93_04495 [Rhizobium sp. MHM7A]
MTHQVTVSRPEYVLPDDRQPIAMNVFVNERHYGVLRFNGGAYVGCMPTHDGKILSGERSLREWRSCASQINKVASDFDRALRPDKFGAAATSILNDRIAAAKSRQMDFFEAAGILPGDVHSMSAEEKDRVLTLYGEWLEANGTIPLF